MAEQAGSEEKLDQHAPSEPAQLQEVEESEEIQKVLEDALKSVRLDLSVSEEREKGQMREGLMDGEDSTFAGKEASSHPDGMAQSLSPRKLPRIEWVDITEQFREAAEQLAPGELIQEVNFSLFDAMSAIELMDSKMDASMQWGTYKEYPRALSEVKEKGLLELDDHPPAKLVGIADEVFACVATWLEGHTLAQTVFTCMYLLETEEIDNIYLRAFSQGMVKIVEYMRECICRGGVYAEDDQQGVCFGFNMLTSVADSSVAAALKEAETKAQVLSEHLTSRDETTANVLRKDAVEGSKEAVALRALLVRIRFTRNFFAFICSLGKGTAQGIEMAQQKLAQCLSLLDDITSSIDIGTKLDPDNPLALGFHPMINQRLLPPSYKPYGILPRAESVRILHRILSHIQKVLTFGKLDSFQDLYSAIVGFCATADSPNVFVRSLLVLLCLQSDRTKLFGSASIENMLKEDARLLVNPPSLNPRSPVAASSQGKEATGRFFGRATSPMIEFLKLHCQHRARQRQKITRSLDILGEFQQETERIDHHIHEMTVKMDPQRQHLACYGSWFLYYITQLMIGYLLLGFEYRLYSPFELHYVYWYLEYLYGWHFTTLRSAEKLLMFEPSTPVKGKRKAKKRKELPKEKEREMAVLNARRTVCVGIMRALEALILSGKLREPTFEHGGMEMCFRHRFLPFASVGTPHLLSYADYKKLAGIENYQGRDVNLYEAASKHFMAAKTALENLSQLQQTEDLDSLLKVVKTNVVIMNLASRGHKKSSNLPPTFDYSLHRHYPVIRIN